MTVIVPMGALWFAYGPKYTYINTHYNSLGFSPFPLSLSAAPHQTPTLSISGRFSGQSSTTAASELTPPPPHLPLSHPRSFDILHALQFSPKHIFVLVLVTNSTPTSCLSCFLGYRRLRQEEGDGGICEPIGLPFLGKVCIYGLYIMYR